jgi:hypothetical protein
MQGTPVTDPALLEEIRRLKESSPKREAPAKAGEKTLAIKPETAASASKE